MNPPGNSSPVPVSVEAAPAVNSWDTKAFAASLIVLAVIVGVLFLQPPGFGDDLTYWSFAFDLHRTGLKAWHVHSFHDLRWPVWGICWVLQKIFNFGFISYLGQPLIYLAGGAVAGFFLGKKIMGSLWAAWACGAAFLFHPLLDTVAYRPIPDLSEGVLGACVMLSWWAMMHARSRSRALLFALLTGAGVYVAESNRITGVFIVPVLVLCTLLEFRPRFHWLIVAGAVAAVLYGMECFFYHELFGDWLHNIHANLGNKGAKGTGAIALWKLPFRFVSSLWQGTLLAPIYCLLTLLGSYLVFQKRLPWSRTPAAEEMLIVQSTIPAQILSRVTFIWFAVLYLEYSCAPQGFKGGWNPLIRDADRFLCGLAVPMSILAVLGLVALLRQGQRWPVMASISRKPVLVSVFSLALLMAGTARDRFDRGFMPEMQRYMAALQPGTKIFTHSLMRSMAYLVDPVAAQKLVWNAPNTILNRDELLEKVAAESDQFWYIRKLVWLNTRKKLQKSQIGEQEQLGSYFEDPDREWITTKLLANGDTPDLVFHRRRKPSDLLPRILSATAAEFNGLIPMLPLVWKNPGEKARHLQVLRWNVPQSLRGQFIRIEVEAASSQVEALAIRLRFSKGKQLRAEYLLKPYLHPQPGKEFFSFEIPADADICEVQPRFSKDAKEILVQSFRAVLTAPPSDKPINSLFHQKE